MFTGLIFLAKDRPEDSIAFFFRSMVFFSSEASLELAFFPFLEAAPVLPSCYFSLRLRGRKRRRRRRRRGKSWSERGNKELLLLLSVVRLVLPLSCTAKQGYENTKEEEEEEGPATHRRPRRRSEKKPNIVRRRGGKGKGKNLEYKSG